MRVRTALLMFLPAAAAGGCGSIMEARQQAPVWFEQAQREIKGEGYPDLCEVPETRAASAPAATWEAEASALRADAAVIQAKVAAAGPIPTEEEIRARAAQLRAEAEAGNRP